MMRVPADVDLGMPLRLGGAPETAVATRLTPGAGTEESGHLPPSLRDIPWESEQRDMVWLFTLLSALGLYWVLAGGLTILWALWTILRLPFDLRDRGDDR
jgi:hypothetical protein